MTIKLKDRIWDPNANPVSLAAEMTGSRTRRARMGWRKRLRLLGREAFVAELADFMGDIEAGTRFRNPGAAFMARLNRLARSCGRCPGLGNGPGSDLTGPSATRADLAG